MRTGKSDIEIRALRSRVKELEKSTLKQARLEKSLQVSETRFRRLFEAAQDGILILDAETGRIVEVNKFLIDMLRYSRGEFLDKKLWQIGAFVDTGKAKEAFETLQTKRFIRYEDLPLQTKDGELINVEFVSNVYTVEGKKVIQCNIRDITERRQLSEQKDDFMNMVSHELRTPLSAMKESIALISEGRLDPVCEKEMFDIAKKNVDRLARLINKVMDIQKIDAGMMKLVLADNDLNEIIDEVHRMMIPLATKKGLGLVLKLDGALPSVKCDKDRISQVLTNLVNNAIKFTEKGDITITSAKRSGSILVSVRDMGPGIKTGDLPKLFRRFSQLDRRPGGTGLGLAISKEIIDMHKGEIGVESEFGRGAKFSFILPVKERRPKIWEKGY